jgi:hypothetical protein
MLLGRLNQSQREELALIEQAYDNPHECMDLSFSKHFSYADFMYKAFHGSNACY